VPAAPESAIDRRLAMEGATEIAPFVMTPHKPNYIIYSYNFKNYEDRGTGQPSGGDDSYKQSEVDFQLSIKFPVWRNIFNTKTHLFAAYTNRSFWQVFDRKDSSPFRETDHEPELWLSHRTKWKLFGLTNRLIQAGIVHQSNGQSGDSSRSWNRVYTNLIFERGHFYFGIKPWLLSRKTTKTMTTRISRITSATSSSRGSTIATTTTLACFSVIR
jgi:phospholipase A1